VSGAQNEEPVTEKGDLGDFRRDDPTSKNRTRVNRLDYVNTWFSGLAVIVSAVALILTGVTLADQQVVNSHQIDLDNLQYQRQQRVYASRVSIWVQVGEEATSVRPRGFDIQVANRSPVPIRSVTMYVPLIGRSDEEFTGSVVVGDMPPCTQVSFRVFARAPVSIERRDEQASFGVSMVFSETVNTWRLTNDGLDLLTAKPPGETGAVGAIRDDPRDLAVCGEGA